MSKDPDLDLNQCGKLLYSTMYPSGLESESESESESGNVNKPLRQQCVLNQSK